MWCTVWQSDDIVRTHNFSPENQTVLIKIPGLSGMFLLNVEFFPFPRLGSSRRPFFGIEIKPHDETASNSLDARESWPDNVLLTLATVAHHIWVSRVCASESEDRVPRPWFS